MITITVKNFYKIIFMSYHSFIFIMSPHYTVLTHTRMYWPLTEPGKVIHLNILSAEILSPLIEELFSISLFSKTNILEFIFKL